MTTLEANVTPADVLLAGAAVALIGFSAWLIVASRRASATRVFGRTVRHPGLAAVGIMCMGCYVLLGLADLTEVTPTGWRTSSRWASAGLLLAAWALLGTYWLLRYRTNRRP